MFLFPYYQWADPGFDLREWGVLGAKLFLHGPYLKTKINITLNGGRGVVGCMSRLPHLDPPVIIHIAFRYSFKKISMLSVDDIDCDLLAYCLICVATVMIFRP